MSVRKDRTERLSSQEPGGVLVELLGVRVEAAELGVVDRRREPGLDHPGDQPQPSSQGVRVGVFGRIVVVAEDSFEPGAAGVRGHGAPRDELEQRVLAFPVRWPAIRSSMARCSLAPSASGTPRRRRNWSAVASEGTIALPPRRACGNASVAMCRAGASPPGAAGPRVDGPGQPAGFLLARMQPRGMPDGHRLEVRAVRVGIADRLHDRQPALFAELREAVERRMQPDVIVDRFQVLGFQRRAWAGFCGRCRRRGGRPC